MTCLDCEHINKKKKSKSCPGYIYCNRLRYWTDLNKMCKLMNLSNIKNNKYYKDV